MKSKINWDEILPSFKYYKYDPCSLTEDDLELIKKLKEEKGNSSFIPVFKHNIFKYEIKLDECIRKKT